MAEGDLNMADMVVTEEKAHMADTRTNRKANISAILSLFCFSNYRNLDTYTPRKSRWETDKLPGFRKNFFKEHPSSKSRSDVGITFTQPTILFF